MRGAVWGTVAVAALAAAAALSAGSSPADGSAPRPTPSARDGKPLVGIVASRQDYKARAPFHEFFFTRAIYSDGRPGAMFAPPGDGGPSWSVDFPKGDRQFTYVIRRLGGLDVYHGENAVELDDPDLRRFPFLYALEVGYMDLSEREVTGLRNYLTAGGTLLIDDFWGTQEWANFEYQISRVLPNHPIVDIPLDHSLFNVFYDIQEILQVPGHGAGRQISMGAPPSYASERDGYEAHVRGIFDEDGRLMVVINWNTDLGDAWEWAEDPYYPLKYSTFAMQLGLNMIIYGMSH